MKTLASSVPDSRVMAGAPGTVRTRTELALVPYSRASCECGNTIPCGVCAIRDGDRGTGPVIEALRDERWRTLYEIAEATKLSTRQVHRHLARLISLHRVACVDVAEYEEYAPLVKLWPGHTDRDIWGRIGRQSIRLWKLV